MSNHTWRFMTDELPPINTPFLAYMPAARAGLKLQTGITREVPNSSGGKSRMTIVGGLFDYDNHPIVKWIPLDEIVPDPEEN